MLVADGDRDMRARISALVCRLDSLPVAAATGAEALAAAEVPGVSLALISVDLLDPCGFEVLHQLRGRHGETLPIALMSANDHGGALRDEVASFLLGADDYFAKPLQEDLFVARVRRLIAQARPATRRRDGAVGRPALTNREREVLGLLVAGNRIPDIAAHLCITRKTTSTHVERILAKLGAHSQAQAVAFALRDGVLDDRGASGQKRRDNRLAAGRW